MTLFERKRFGGELWHDYAIGSGWTNYTLIHIDVECEHFSGVSELSLSLLGVHLRLWWIHNPEAHRALSEMAEKVMLELSE